MPLLAHAADSAAGMRFVERLTRSGRDVQLLAPARAGGWVDTVWYPAVLRAVESQAGPAMTPDEINALVESLPPGAG